MALSLSVYRSCFSLESFARVNTSAAHIPQYLRAVQSHILLKYSANYIFSFHVFLWDFTDTFLTFRTILKLTFNKWERSKEPTLMNVWGTSVLGATTLWTRILTSEVTGTKRGASSAHIGSLCLQTLKTNVNSFARPYYTKEVERKVAKQWYVRSKINLIHLFIKILSLLWARHCAEHLKY